MAIKIMPSSVLWEKKHSKSSLYSTNINWGSTHFSTLILIKISFFPVFHVPCLKKLIFPRVIVPDNITKKMSQFSPVYIFMILKINLPIDASPYLNNIIAQIQYKSDCVYMNHLIYEIFINLSNFSWIITKNSISCCQILVISTNF